MNRERERELLRRLSDPQAPQPGPLGERSVRNPASAYTCPARFARERDVLFRSSPNLVGLSVECPEPGDYLTADLGGVPVVVIRAADGGLRGFVNACRHRASTLLQGCGHTGSGIVCPYHGWTYGLDGALRGRPRAEPGFSDVPKAELSLHGVAVAEAHGLVFARATGKQPFTVDAALHGAQEELGPYALERYHPIETRVQELPFNWKLVIDTFCEPYHIPWLHKDTIAPHYLFDRWIFDPYGPHSRFIGLRSSVVEELAKPEAERRLLPHGTTQYLLVPNAVLVHQMDHLELWRVTPLAVDRTRVATSLFAPEAPASPKALDYWLKNLDVLLQVTGKEDFPMMARIHANLASGAVPEVVYGRMEPALVHFHAAIDAALAKAGASAPATPA
ncbi:MAG TPA: aromatic ring-hydroxylating dioxygenase subunit alpha [Myxococcota bacterium]|jgi:phenylpropionate dioxygenase-like ring-hydroxylating dioxygenase large terminal subunit|nr:aromatic ring-hydroxylating dioxygenase subunit alpha [Myxococcota bacterium]